MAPAAGLRVVAINRRNYAGSTPFSQEDLTVIHNGTDTQKEEFLKARGLEILNFMDIFVQQNDVPTILDDGKGGIALLGWSLGNSFTLAAISHFDSLPTDAQSRLASRMRSLIMQGWYQLYIYMCPPILIVYLMARAAIGVHWRLFAPTNLVSANRYIHS